MRAVVLAGGKGTRLAPYTTILPKPLMPIDGMPILEVMIRQMKRYGIDDITLTVGHLSYLLQSYFQDGSRFGVQIRYALEAVPLGTAGPLAGVEDLADTFLVTNGDVLTTLDFKELLTFHEERGAIATIAINERDIKINLGVVHTNGRHEVEGYTEKPTMNYRVSMGIYVFEPRVLNFIPKGEYLDFPDLVQKLLDEGERVVGYPFDGYWKDLGNEVEYREASEEFVSMREDILGEGA
jgi:NDP-sugar pyrophosphorylase family protein